MSGVGTVNCAECIYLRTERQGMWLDNGASLDVAIKMCAGIRCHGCKAIERKGGRR